MEALRTSGETRTWIILRSGWFLIFLSFNFFCAFSAIGTVIKLFANRHKRTPSTEEIRQHGTLDAPTLLKYRTVPVELGAQAFARIAMYCTTVADFLIFNILTLCAKTNSNQCQGVRILLN